MLPPVTMNDADEFSLTQPMPMLIRLIYGSAGLFAIIMPVWEFRHAFLHPQWISLFFAALVLGAWSVGGVFVASAIFGEEQRWRVSEGEIAIDRQTLLGKWTTLVRGPDVDAMSIEQHTWDSGPDTFSVAMKLKNGEKFEAGKFEKRANAEALEARLRRRLHLA